MEKRPNKCPDLPSIFKVLFEVGSEGVWFLSVFEKTLDTREMTVHPFFECLLYITYINSVTHGAFYFIDLTCSPVFTYIDTFAINIGWKKILHYLSIWSWESIPWPIFAARSSLSNLAKLINAWQVIRTLSQERLNDFFIL